MIVRILGEGQWTVTDEQLPTLNALDSAVEVGGLRLDPATHRVTAGYAILQPRVSVTMSSA